MAKSSLQYWPTYSLLGVGVILLVGFVGFVYADMQKKVPVQKEATASPANVVVAEMAESGATTTDAWETIYPNTKTMTIGQTLVNASVAKSWPERIKGLSDTPYLPEEVVKLFVFDSPGAHSIWMKDMNYDIDIIWVNGSSTIVHVEEGAAPESFPAMFTPKKDALYVIETAAGFVEKNSIVVGDSIVLPNL